MPVLSVIAGPNGSGKSTLTSLLEAEGVEFGQYLNADDIAREFGEVNEFVSRKAQQIVRDLREAALAEGRDHAFETVMSHPSHIDYMLDAKRRGFEVRLYFVATDDPVINLDRVANRVEKGGHSVPEDRVVARYERSLRNLPGALAASDHARIYDNSMADRPMRLIAAKSQGYFLGHLDGGGVRLKQVDPAELPVWWLAALLEIKPKDSFVSGPIA